MKVHAEGRIRTAVGRTRQIYSLLPLTARPPLQSFSKNFIETSLDEAGGRIRTADRLFTKQLLYH